MSIGRSKHGGHSQLVSNERESFFSAYLLSLAPSVLMGFQLCEHLVKQPKGVLSSTAFCCPLLHAFMESTEFSTKLSLRSKLSHYSLIFSLSPLKKKLGTFDSHFRSVQPFPLKHKKVTSTRTEQSICVFLKLLIHNGGFRIIVEIR